MTRLARYWLAGHLDREKGLRQVRTENATPCLIIPLALNSGELSHQPQRVLQWLHVCVPQVIAVRLNSRLESFEVDVGAAFGIISPPPTDRSESTFHLGTYM